MLLLYNRSAFLLEYLYFLYLYLNTYQYILYILCKVMTFLLWITYLKTKIDFNYVIKDWNRDIKQIFGSECKVTNTVYVIALKAVTQSLIPTDTKLY